MLHNTRQKLFSEIFELWALNVLLLPPLKVLIVGEWIGVAQRFCRISDQAQHLAKNRLLKYIIISCDFETLDSSMPAVLLLNSDTSDSNCSQNVLSPSCLGVCHHNNQMSVKGT